MAEFKKGQWTGGFPETVSGGGSTLKNTQDVRQFLPKVISDYNIQSIFDAPCGDRNWIKTIEFDTLGCTYKGGEIVSEIVDDIGMDSVTVFDIRSDQPPKSDLWFCRDCLFHLSEVDIRQAIQNMVFDNNNFEYCMITSHINNDKNKLDKRNKNISTGEFRVLIFEEFDNFGLGEPIDIFYDDYDGPLKRNMLLFDLKNIREK